MERPPELAIARDERIPARIRLGSLRDLCYVLFRHWGKGLFVTASVFALAFWYAESRDERYLSEAELLVRMGRESVAIDLVAATGRTIGILPNPGGQVQTGVAILESENLLRQLVGEFGASVFLPDDWSSDKLEPEEAAVLAARKSLTVKGDPESSILRVGFESSSPAVASEVLGRLVELFLDKHVSIHRTSGAYEFLSGQMTILDQRLEGLRERLAHIRTEAGIYSFDEQRRALADRIAALEREEADLQAQIDAGSAKCGALRRDIAELDPIEVVSETVGDANPVADRIRTQLLDLRLEEKQLLSRLQPESREVRDVRDRIEIAEGMLEAESEDRSRRTRGPNDIRRALELALLQEQAELAGRTRRLAGTRERLDAAHRRLDTINSHELDLRRIEREIELGEKNRLTYADSLEQARIDRALEEQKISNIRVVQSPSTPSRPLGPNRLWVLAVGGILALFLGLGVVFFAEYVDESLQDPEAAESALQVPVLGSLPRARFLRRLPRLLARGKDPRAVWGATRPMGLSAAIAGRVLSAAEYEDHAIIGVVGNATGVGATTVACCLAMNLVSRAQGPVLLVDATGAGQRRPASGAHSQSGAVVAGPVEGLSLTHLTATSEMPAEAAIRAYSAHFTYVVVDLEPPHLSEITVDWAAICHAMLFVVSPDRSRGLGARRSVQALTGARGRVVGAVINKRRYPIPRLIYRLL